ncbi:unnamed protein product [Spodoptera exigua]|nr:unnamed protein product [Spodoptera exigua]
MTEYDSDELLRLLQGVEPDSDFDVEWESTSEEDDNEVEISWSAAEVRAACCVDERRLELRVALQRAHPLRPPRLDAGAAPALPGRPAHWLALYLAAGGRLRGALRLWAGAVSARVAAAPQCYICYCRLHPASGRLPRVPCHQCKNKFHNVCLRKWFATSNKSNCPLCRAAF